jgi:oligopeptide transport system ATP-binding protein
MFVVLNSLEECNIIFNIVKMENLITVNKLKKYFSVKRGLFSLSKDYVKAVDDVSFSINKGETLALIGESGCGKSTTGLCLLRLLKPDEGEIRFAGKSILHLNSKELKALRRKMQVVFQDPFSFLNPKMKVFDLIAEPIKIHALAESNAMTKDRVAELLRLVGIEPDFMHRYPHEFSGGQRQRIGLARALAVEPQVIVADEPVSALDISLRSQILNLLLELQQKFALTFLIIAHDLVMVRHISHKVAVMYLGRIVETGEVGEVFHHPLHPYTKGLISSQQYIKGAQIKRSAPLVGEPPSPIEPPSGCHFHPRCRWATPLCSKKRPVLREVASDHSASCYLNE